MKSDEYSKKARNYLKKHKQRIITLIPTLKIPSASRISLDIELKRMFKRLEPGVVLDVGAGRSVAYKPYIPHTKYMTMDIDSSFNPDICCDLHQIEWQSEYFDTVIAVEVLEHLYDPQMAVNQIYRILKRQGVFIASTRFLFRYHGDPKDYYRFTWDSLKYLFRQFGEVEVYHLGNRIQVLWEIINCDYGLSQIILNLLNPLFAKIRFKNTKFPNGFIVYARK